MAYAKDAKGNVIVDKDSGNPVWCGSAASRLEHYKMQSAPELAKELAITKEKLAYYERKYGRFETKEWKEGVKQAEEAYASRISRKVP
jgi:hypothetical protein